MLNIPAAKAVYLRLKRTEMAEDLTLLRNATKAEQYQSLLPQIAALLHGETDAVANMANVCAALKEQFNWFWVGFYLIKGEELVLGPFQGPVACTRIAKGKGVCGTVWARQEALIVPDVEQFPGHIACASASRSEVVLPFYQEGKIVGVLDVDSEKLAHFDDEDKHYLEQVLQLLDMPGAF